MRFRFWILIATGLFLVGMCSGLLISRAMPAQLVDVFTEELSTLEQLSAALSPFHPATAVFIFLLRLLTLIGCH